MKEFDNYKNLFYVGCAFFGGAGFFAFIFGNLDPSLSVILLVASGVATYYAFTEVEK